MKWWETRLHVPHEAAEALSAVLSEWPEVQGVVLEGGQHLQAPHPEFGEWMDEQLFDTADTVLTFYVPEHVREQDLRARLADALQTVHEAGLDVSGAAESADIQKIDETSWENAWKEDFQPIPVGKRLIIVPKWWLGKTALGERLPVVLDPGMAFGTGTHPTTQLCLTALQEIDLSDADVMDVGCGTAVLAIAAARLGARDVFAVDIDPVAVQAAERNVADNGLAGRVQVLQGDLLSAVPERSFDVIVANILRDIVIRLAPAAAERIAAGGCIITSGFVTDQAPAVESALRQHGFDIVRRLEKDDWVALVGRMPG